MHRPWAGTRQLQGASAPQRPLTLFGGARSEPARRAFPEETMIEATAQALPLAPLHPEPPPPPCGLACPHMAWHRPLFRGTVSNETSFPQQLLICWFHQA